MEILLILACPSTHFVGVASVIIFLVARWLLKALKGARRDGEARGGAARLKGVCTIVHPSTRRRQPP